MGSIDKLNKLLELKKVYANGGGDKAIAKQHEKGVLTARERLDYFFDEGSFVEVDMFVRTRSTNFGIDKSMPNGESVVTGYGYVNGRLVFAFSQDFTISGGSLGEMHAKKITKILDMALKVGAPVVCINDSGGARIQEGIGSLQGYGEIFFRNTRASGVIPQITAIMGPCAGGASYSPAITDFIFMVDKTSYMFITGPQVLKTVIGEEVTTEELGGGYTHNATSGVAHYLSSNDQHCLDQIKTLLSYLPQNNLEVTPAYELDESELNKSVDYFNSIIPDDPNLPYDMHGIIGGLIDEGSFFEYQALFANNIITGFARIGGISVGIVANQPKVMGGCLDINASDKSARFVRTCDAFNIPVVTIVDTPGFLPGTAQEHNGIIRHGAKMLFAYSEATVPKIQLITRKAYGGSYIAMSSKSLGADIALAWPTAEIAVMGASGAVNIIFRKEIDAAEDKKAKRAEIIADYEEQFSNPYRTAELGFIDDVITPAESRRRIIDALMVLSTKQETLPSKKHGNIPL